MTSQPIQQPSAPISTGSRERTATVRFLIAGLVLLGVTIMDVVQHWTTVASTGFVGDHALQLVGAAIGAALVVTGIVKYFRH